MSTPKFTAPETPVTREEVYYDAILRGLNGDSPAPVIPTPVWRMEEYLAAIAEAASSGGGSSLPPVTSSDNGKVLAVEDGAWAADSNLFVVNMPTYNTADKTYAETVAAVEAGKNVVVTWNAKVYTFLARTSSEMTFIGNIAVSSRSIFGSAELVRFKSTSISVGDIFRFLNNPNSADNGSELIVKNGSWAAQQKKFIVTLTPTSPDYSGTMDKTVAEINAAYEAGQEIVFRIFSSAAFYYDIVATVSSFGDTDDSKQFRGYGILNDNLIEILTPVGVEHTDYSTTVYSLTPAS